MFLSFWLINAIIAINKDKVTKSLTKPHSWLVPILTNNKDGTIAIDKIIKAFKYSELIRWIFLYNFHDILKYVIIISKKVAKPVMPNLVNIIPYNPSIKFKPCIV